MKRTELLNYFEGNSSLSEQNQIKESIRNNKVSKKDLDGVFEGYWDENLDFTKDEVFSGVLFNEIVSKIELNKLDKPTPSLNSKASNSFRVFKYAATISIFFSFIIYFLQDQLQPSTPKPINIEMVLKQTSKGQKSTIMLSDGSKVVLNSGSQISYPKYFTDSSRVIQLKGEAYFEVAKDISRPFSVIANDVKTTALGTSFNINCRFTKIRISLATGKVVVENNLKRFDNENPRFLEPGESLEIESSTNESSISKFDFNKEFLWKEGVLFFHNAEFDEIKNKLEMWYDVEFEVTNQPIRNKKFTGRFDNETLRSVMESVGFTLGYDYFVNGKKVKIIYNS